MIKVIRALWELLRLEHGLMFFLAVLSGAFISLSDVRSISIEDLIFKQKTAYEIMPSLVGSEMCIRDRLDF